MPGRIFLSVGQKKETVNHYYLSVDVIRGRVGAGISYRVTGWQHTLRFPEQMGRAMADNEQEGGAAAEGAEAAPAKKGKLKLIIAAVGFLAVIGGGIGAWMMMSKKGHGEEKHAEAATAKPPSYVDVPEIMVNLVGLPGERVQYLKIKVVLEVKEAKTVEAIKPSMPRVSDIFQTYMRELRAGDLNGSAGLFRLKEELTRRVNDAVAPQQVGAVLFKEIVIQ